MAPSATTAAPTSGNGSLPASLKGASRIQPDPELVTYPSFESTPKTPEDFYQRAKQVSDLLHLDEAVRDRGNVVPYRQVKLLKDAGLVTLLGPVASGGAGLTWREAYHVVRIVAQGDGSLAQLLGYHYIWFWAAALVGTDAQRTRIESWLTENKYFVGGAVNPRDADLIASQHPNDPSKLVFNGKKTFSTGSKVSDVTILEGALADANGAVAADAPHVFAPALSRQAGIVYGDEWVDVLGMRGTQSGGVSINQVEVDWRDALGFEEQAPHTFQPLGPYNTLNLPAIQLVFTSFYLGITQGALARGLEYTKANTRAWPYAAQPVSRGTDEAYIQEGYGTLQARVWASEAQINQAIEEGSAILHTNPRQQVTAEQRAKWAIHVAASKLNIVDTGLEVTNKVYELQGARSISAKYGFDVAYRDLRTHSLHDPIAHKRSEVGRYALLGPQQDGWPVPTWYT
jgi:alkylation response protein AidB-like acyl-CoA dehydrogenase